MDVRRAPPWNIDPLPFAERIRVVSSKETILPPIFIRWMAGAIVNDDASGKARTILDRLLARWSPEAEAENKQDEVPSLPVPTWVKWFNITTTNVLRNGYVEPPDVLDELRELEKTSPPGAPTEDQLARVFVPKKGAPTKVKPKPGQRVESGWLINRRYHPYLGEPAEKRRTQLTIAWFERRSRSYADEIAAVRKARSEQ